MPILRFDCYIITTETFSTLYQQVPRNLHINKIFASYIFQDLVFMNWHIQLLFTQKIIINNLPCIQKRPGNISNPSRSTRGLRCVYILLFYIQHISFKIHQVIGFYFEYQSYVRNLHFFVQIFMCIAPIRNTTNSC